MPFVLGGGGEGGTVQPSNGRNKHSLELLFLKLFLIQKVIDQFHISDIQNIR